MKTLYVALRHDYGDPSRGDSFEHQTFYPVLARMSEQFTYFDFGGLLEKHGYFGMNALLCDTVKQEEPDLLFCVLFENQLDRQVLSKIKEETSTTTVNWFCDDHWRFDCFSKFWAPCFDWVTTTCTEAFDKYQRLPGVQPILTQWAVNPSTYRPIDGRKTVDVSFVGQRRPARARHVASLHRSGVKPVTHGLGWPGGRLSVSEMVELFNASRISLNFADSSAVGSRITRRPMRQLKARVFELAGCASFVLSEYEEDLPNFYMPDEEVVVFQGSRDLVDKVRYYLSHDEERLRIAQAGYVRTLREHTYENRLQQLLTIVGLSQNGAPTLDMGIEF